MSNKYFSSSRFVWFLILIFLIGVQSSISAGFTARFAGVDFQNAACTSIMVGRLASADGSVMTAHSCDGNYRTWVTIVPAREYKEGETTNIVHGTMHTETAWDMRGLVIKGAIPQVKKTYAYLYTAYPCMNEKQLAIGETTIGGKRELYNSEGLFVIEELERLMLERCRTAREAIKLLGELVKEYGYSDRGECITIADPKEVWQLEIFGAGPLEIGGVWAAARIPDGHVGISANIPRIGKIDLNNPDFFMASDNVFSCAEEMGWWNPDSEEPFVFWKAYSGRHPYSDRELFVFQKLAPSLDLNEKMEELPFSVKPEKKVSIQDMMSLYRETYSGTDWDKTKNLMVKKRRSDEMIKSTLANPFMSYDMITLLNTLKPGTVPYRRSIAIAGCSYSHIIQCRNWLPDPVGAVAWFAFDSPGQSPRIPVFAGVKELPPSFAICAQHRFRLDSACWAFRRANKLATVRWGIAGKYIEEAVKEFEDKALSDLPVIEDRAVELFKKGNSDPNFHELRDYLTSYTNNFARAAIQKYMELGDKFWGMFGRGF
ncbi:MAG: C69 family dipeptidase [Candidatus Aminicenantes bacterium]|nr:C69 family dipeptidase [Candidatus Aminicenantes bacterium]